MDAALARFRHIAIEGPIGVGKSTLARRLARHLGARTLLEKAEDNPFLDRFYADMPGYAFQVQLAFLFQRVRQLRDAAQPGMFGEPVVSDFIFPKDALFARLNLSDGEYRMYAPMYAQFESEAAPPDVVIWLQASPQTLLARVRRRALASKQAIDAGYLQRVADAYVELFRRYDAAPVLAVGTERFNPGERDTDFGMLVERLASMRARREFLDAPAESPLA
jgi:deoxyguanosine kinase